MIYLHLCLLTINTNESTTYYPETLLIQPDEYYITGQKELKIIKTEKKQRTQKHKKQRAIERNIERPLSRTETLTNSNKQ